MTEPNNPQSPEPPPTQKPPANPLASKATLLDLFAVHALQALLAASASPKGNGDILPEEDGKPPTYSMMHLARCCGWETDTTLGSEDGQYSLKEFIASECYELAHAMLCEREKFIKDMF